MRQALSQQDYPKDLVECACGAEYRPRVAPCDHNNAQPYTARFRTPRGDGIEEGVIGPEGNRVPLVRRIFEEDGIQHEWVDSAGRAHLGIKEAYPEID